MRLLHRVVACVTVVLAAVWLGCLPAAATPAPSPPTQARLDLLTADPETRTLSYVLGATALAEGAELDRDTVQLSLDGLSVTPTSVESASAQPIERTAILAIDTSGSMRGQKIADARNAATAFVESAPPDVKIGIVTFDDVARTLLPPTSDRATVAAAIGQIEALRLGETAMFNGIEQAVSDAGSEGIRSVLVLTDGENTVGPATRDSAVAAITEAGVGLDVVALGDYSAFVDDLNAVAAAGKGVVVGAEGADELAARFAQVAEALDTELFVTADVPRQFYESNVTVSTSVQTSAGERLADEAALSLADVKPPIEEIIAPRPVAAPDALGTPAFWLALIGIFAAVATLLATAAVTVTRQHTKRARVAALIGGEPLVTTAPEPAHHLHLRDRVTEVAGRLLSARGMDKTLAERLESAGLPLRPAEWVLLHVLGAVGLGLVLLALTGHVVPALIGVVVGVMGPLAFLERRGRKRQEEFTSALPETLQMISGSLSAGLTLRQGVENVAEDGRPVVREEVRRALAQVRLGKPLEDALDEVAERMHSKDFSWIVMVTRIQREVGGNLPELLGLVSATLRERDRLRRQVRVLSAEGRISAWVVGLLPIAFVAYMLIARPSYLEPLVEDKLGWAMLLGGGTLFLGGVFWLSRITNLKV